MLLRKISEGKFKYSVPKAARKEEQYRNSRCHAEKNAGKKSEFRVFCETWRR